MAVYNLDKINESMHEEEVEESSVLDNMLEACEYMMNMIDEADRNLKNEKNAHSTSGPEDYSKWNTDELKSEYKNRANAAKRSKYDRGNSDASYTNGAEYRTHSRAKAANIGKELAKRGEKVSSLKLTEVEPATWDAARKERASRDYMENKPGSHTYNITKFDNAHIDDHPGTNYPGKAEREETKQVIKDHLAKKKTVKEACLYILSRLDDIE